MELGVNQAHLAGAAALLIALGPYAASRAVAKPVTVAELLSGSPAQDWRSPDPDNTLYVSDALANRIVAIPDATTRTTSAGTGREVTKDGQLQRPLALIMLPNGHLMACNARNGKVVELDPATGKQIYAQWVDTNQAQSPPGNGDLFGMALRPDGKGFYYVEDDMNAVVEAR